jgi:hypothetical protein
LVSLKTSNILFLFVPSFSSILSRYISELLFSFLFLLLSFDISFLEPELTFVVSIILISLLFLSSLDDGSFLISII